MELEWETRPQQPRMHPRQQWHDQQPQPPVSFTPPTQSMLPSSPPSNYGQRRRSSAANSRPAVPPPAFPIPNLPSNPGSPSMSPQSPPISELSETTHALSGQFLNHRSAPSGSFMRPSASPNLSAVAAFSQARQASSSTSQNQSSPMSSSIDDLSDPPPQSYLPSSSRFPDRSNESQSSHSSSIQGRDRGGSLLAPPSEHSHRSENRPSSRRALTRALELAREAVQLDSTNEDPEAAVQAYAQSVALLSEVMERVRSGEDSTESHRRRRRRSVAAQEEEIRRLQNIHDTYADRMNILSIIYSIPAVPYANPNLYSNAASEVATSPTTPSPPSDSSPQIPQQAYTHYLQDDSHPHTNGVTIPTQDSDNFDGVFLDESVLRSTAGISSLSSTQHPYAGQYNSGQPQPTTSRMSVTYRRTRAASNLPPKAPPPVVSLPPAPATVGDPSNTEQTAYVGKRPETAPRSIDPRPIDNALHEATRHRRNHSGLVPLQEENDELPRAENQPMEEGPSRRGTPRRESPPLPPLPSPPLGPDATPRSNGRPPSSPRMANIISPRPRGTSLQTRNELTNVPHIHPPSNGSISQRRNPPSTRSSSPAESTGSVGSAPYQMPLVSTMPGNGPFNGRSRSSSQPGRRPSIVGGQIGSEDRPPLPAGPNGTPRKVSVPTKLNPIAPTLQIDSNHLQNNSVAFSNNPTTPVSPLPPAPPSDPLLKPYHMMHLLRTTMTVSTGGYVTRRLHVPFDVWSQGGAKLLNLDEKIRVVTVLCDALEELQNSSAEYFGAGNVSSGMALGIGSIGRKEAETWLAKLEDFSNVCVGVVTSFGKKLGVGEGFVSKKATLGDKITRRLDKFTNGKNLDSPAAYVQGLKKLFLLAQLLDEHTRAVTSQPISQSYAAFPYDIRTSAEQKLKRASEFFASVVLTFVIRDLSQLLDKYVKKCEKWLAE